MRRWGLFLDETGNFSIANEPVAVGGFVFEETEVGVLPEDALRNRLRQLEPFNEYPLHATDLRMASSAVWRALRGSRPAPSIAAPLRTLCDAVRHLAGDRPALTAANARIAQSHPVEQRAVHDAQTEALRGAAELVRRVSEVSGTDCSAMVASFNRSEPGDASEAPEFEPRDRYLRVLSVLFERIAALLGDEKDVHVVCVRAAQRGLGRDRMIEVRDLEAAAQAADARSRIRWEILPPEPYDEKVHPGLVLADVICNSLLPLRHRTWQSVESWSVRSFGLCTVSPCFSLAMPMPSLTAAGPERTLYRARVANEPFDVSALPRWWGVEQAERWARVVAATRKGDS